MKTNIVTNVVIAFAVGGSSTLSLSSENRNIFESTNNPNNSFVCPPINVPLNIQPSDGPITIEPTAQSGDLCTLTLQDVSGIPVPVARSYDGSDWEVTAGPFASILSPPTCFNGKCTFEKLPEPDSTQKKYVLTSYFHIGFGAQADAARLLEQATFGPTRATIDALAAVPSADKYEAWVKDQIATPMTSHREYYRKR